MMMVVHWQVFLFPFVLNLDNIFFLIQCKKISSFVTDMFHCFKVLEIIGGVFFHHNVA